MTPHADDFHPSGRIIEPALDRGFLQPGITTKSEVLLAIGAPQETAPGETSMTWRWSMLTHWAPGGWLGCDRGYFPTSCSLVVDFDTDGRVTGFRRSPPRQP